MKTLPLLTFTQSKRAKSVGFDWPTEYSYSHWNSPATDGPGVRKNWNALTYELWGKKMPLTSAPEIALFLQWCREVKGFECGVSICIYDDYPHQWFDGYEFRIYKSEVDRINSVKTSFKFDTHTEAETALVNELLTILEKQK